MTNSTNPKDKVGRSKLPLHLWPPSATAFGSVGMLEGATKYGRNNFRAAPVAASVYVAAAMRHLAAWYEGEEVTAEGGPHLGNALACIAILVDAKVNGTLVDDRQFTPRADAYAQAVAELTAMANKLVEGLRQRIALGELPQALDWDARNGRVEEA